MAISFSYWNDCVIANDLEAMWMVPEVRTEWLKAGEVRGQKVHISRDPDGQPYLTQTEMRAIADIIIGRHFLSQIDPNMICTIAELECDRQLLVTRSDNKSKEVTMGLLQLKLKTAEWLNSELGYHAYATEGDKEFLFQPFTNVYFGAAYIKWLSNFENKERSEEFIIRAYKGGTKKATHKSTLRYWKSYLSVKESFPRRSSIDDVSPPHNALVPAHPHAEESSRDKSDDMYWDSIASKEDIDELWNHPEVRKEWNKLKDRSGKVRLFRDENHRPYLSRVELKAVADIVLVKHLHRTNIRSAELCAISEVVSMRFLHGVGANKPGIMGIDYSTTYWLYLELGYRAYKFESVEDLSNPFVSMYFGAAYVAWLTEYEGRERTREFVVEAYCVGPKNVNPHDTSTLWLKYVEALSHYEDSKRNNDSCTIM